VTARTSCELSRPVVGMHPLFGRPRQVWKTDRRDQPVAQIESCQWLSIKLVVWGNVLVETRPMNTTRSWASLQPCATSHVHLWPIPPSAAVPSAYPRALSPIYRLNWPWWAPVRQESVALRGDRLCHTERLEFVERLHSVPEQKLRVDRNGATKRSYPRVFPESGGVVWPFSGAGYAGEHLPGG